MNKFQDIFFRIFVLSDPTFGMMVEMSPFIDKRVFNILDIIYTERKSSTLFTILQ